MKGVKEPSNYLRHDYLRDILQELEISFELIRKF